jgi:transposase
MEGVEGKYKRFDKEFKLSAVKIVSEGEEKAADVARNLNIKPNRLYLWIKNYSKNGEKAFPGKGHLTEIAALRRKLRDAQLDNEILKKALGIFSKPGENGSSL